MSVPPGGVVSLDALRSALDAGSEAVAIHQFTALMRQSPPAPDVEAWLWQAWHAFEPAAGRDAFATARVAARSDETAMSLFFARLAFGVGHGAVALAACRSAIRAASTRPAPAFLLCALLLRQGSPEAQHWLQLCLDTWPQPSAGWIDLGEALLQRGKPDAALVCFGRGPPDVPLALRRGLLARELGRLEQARGAFDEAVRLDPRAPRAWFLLGACAQDQRDFATAVEAYRTALALAPQLAEAAVNLGTVLQETGDLAGARASYARAVAARPDSFGRVAQALTTSPTGELWLDLDRLRASLAV